MPPRGRKRKSDQSAASENQVAPATTGQMVATKFDGSTETPNKRQKTGVTIAQKQALLDNLQLEVTERARKLRAQYNLQAQGLRTRIEIRVNRIPRALRKAKMGDLMLKYSNNQHHLAPKQTVAAMADRAPPPVPAKDFQDSNGKPRAVGRGIMSPPRPHPVGRPPRRLSDDVAAGDKENLDAHLDNPKKRQKGARNVTAQGTQMPTQVLSPASSNSRLNPRDRERTAPPSPAKTFIARPVSPAKQAAATNLLSTMVEKARSTRAGTARKATTSSTTSSAAPGTTGTRAWKATATVASKSTAASRAARRVSGISEASDVSTSTVVRKTGRATGATAATKARKVTTTAAQTAAAKKTVMSSIKKGVAGTAAKKAAATKTATAAATGTATTRSGRVLRKRAE